VKYRADIDGFRSLAVMLVILYHFDIGALHGGFIGVDVFFVLSGYLISSIVFEQLNTGAFTFGGFYFRRIRRLFPVYFLVMACTCVVAFLIMLPIDFREFGKSLFASTFYLSNVLFYSGTGYFDTASHLKPLLHTWSLSVEEQFYLVFPLLAWLLSRRSKTTIYLCFAALTALSFALAIFYIKLDESAVFFLYPFRAWEMFLGTLIAITPIAVFKSALSRQLGASVGILCILLPTFLYDSTTLFPGLAALAPCIGSVLIIESARSGSTWVSSIFKQSLFVAIGKISYSLYLWHWPIFVLYSYSKPHGIDGVDATLMLALTFAFSIAGYFLVEKPFRNGNVVFYRKTLPVYGTTALLSFVLAGFGFITYKSNGIESRLDPKVAQFAHSATDFLKDTSHCEDEGNNTLPEFSYCRYGDPFNKNTYTLIWGDSHAGAMMPAFKRAVAGKNIDALQIWSVGCPALIGIEKDESVSSTIEDQKCGEQNRKVKKFIEQNHDKITSITLIGRWAYYLNGGGVGHDADNTVRISIPEQPALNTEYAFITAFENTVEWLNNLNIQVFVLQQPPEISYYEGRALAIELTTGKKSLEEIINSYANETLEGVRQRQGKLNTLMYKKQNEGHITILDTHKYFCDENGCNIFVDGQPSYADNNHLSGAGAERISTVFSPLFQPLEASEK